VFLGELFLVRYLPGRRAMDVTAAAFIALVAVASLTGHNASVALLVVLAGLVGMSVLANRLGVVNEQAEQLVVELEESRLAEARAAGLAERQRLAREMHDVLAHSLSGLMLQLEGARMLAAQDPGDPRLVGAVERAHHLGRAGLEEARRAISMLRDDDLPGPERMTALLEQFERDYGVPCQLTISGAVRPLGSEGRLAIYRVAQEALTNVAKHSRPDRVELHLAYGLGRVCLAVEDFATTPCENGNLVAQRDAGGGYGLTGMRERAELLGGHLKAQATPTGFRVELEVPS
jgi:signal transduction histidine kinase